MPHAIDTQSEPITQTKDLQQQMPQDAPPCPVLKNELRLTDQQLLAIRLLLTGRSDFFVYKTLKIDRKTLYNWRTKNLDFQSHLIARRRELFEHLADRLRALLSDALDTLDKQVHDRYAPTSHRAARTLLHLSRIALQLEPVQPHRSRPAQPPLVDGPPGRQR